MIVGGKDANYPSFQGQVAGVNFRVGEDSVISSLAEYEEFVHSCNPPPVDSCERKTASLPHIEYFGKDTAFDHNNALQTEDVIFAQEYSVSGWFKWVHPSEQNIWHTAFRLTINPQSVNENVQLLGDRDLAVFVGDSQVDNILAFTTYTYTDLNGRGNPNYWQAVPYENDLTSWHYIYFGYSRKQRAAYVYVEFQSRKAEQHFTDVNHFDAP